MENQNIEYKELWKDEYMKWICGFANASGGRIYIGKIDDGTVKGLTNSKKLLEYIPNKVRDIFGIIVDVNLLCENDQEYIEIIVSPSSIPISYGGRYYYRSGSTKQELRGNALNQFLLKKMNITWESTIIDDAKLEEASSDSFNIFKENAIRSGRMDEKDLKINKKGLLEKLQLLENGKLTRAGVLLFHHKAEKWVHGAHIKIGYFSSDAEIEYQDEIYGSLLYQAKNAIDLLYLKYLKAQISYEGIHRIETYPYPKEAIREAILNAIAHKNYERQVPIQIKVFDDKIIIGNTCVFPEGWTQNNLFENHSSVPYNPLIAKTLYRAGFIESWGRGIEKIINACIKAGNPLPKYSVDKSGIMVTFESIFDKNDPINTGDYTINDPVNYVNDPVNPVNGPVNSVNDPVNSVNDPVNSVNDPVNSANDPVNSANDPVNSVNDPVNSVNDLVNSVNDLKDSSKLTTKERQEKILYLMQKNSKITRLELSEVLSVSDATIKRDIDKLKKEDLIDREGSDKSGYWLVKKN